MCYRASDEGEAGGYGPGVYTILQSTITFHKIFCCEGEIFFCHTQICEITEYSLDFKPNNQKGISEGLDSSSSHIGKPSLSWLIKSQYQNFAAQKLERLLFFSHGNIPPTHTFKTYLRMSLGGILCFLQSIQPSVKQP